jgi:hypothetical protein
MCRVARTALLVLAFAGSLEAQTFSLDNSRVTRWMLETETGSESSFGFKLPHVGVGFSAERPVAKHFELQALVSYSPDKKYITNDGNSLKFNGTGLYWITRGFALTGGLHHSNLWTSQFNKSSTAPSAGVAFREAIGGLPGRIYLGYLFPTGCQWGSSCPIQSSRTKGVEFYWETRMSSHFRMGVEMGIYHFLSQSNQFRPDIPRIGSFGGITLLTLKYEFHRGDMDKLY